MKTSPILNFDGCGLNLAAREYRPRLATIAPTMRDEYRKDAEAVARASSACHGLDLPADLQPGSLAAVIEAARAVLMLGRFATVSPEANAAAVRLHDLLRPFTGEGRAPEITLPELIGKSAAGLTGPGDTPETPLARAIVEQGLLDEVKPVDADFLRYGPTRKPDPKRLDGDRLDHLEMAIRQCPHARLTFIDDPHEEDGDAEKPFMLEVSGCDTFVTRGATLRELLDNSIAEHEADA